MTHRITYERQTFNVPYEQKTSRDSLGQLELSHLCQVAAGREWLRLALARLVCLAIPQKIDELPCTSGDPSSCMCVQGVQVWWKSLLELWVMSDSLFRIPLRMLDEAAKNLKCDVEGTRLGICQGRRRRIAQVLRAVRQYIWDELPYAFGVKPREEGVVYGYQSYLYVFPYECMSVNNDSFVQRCCLSLSGVLSDPYLTA